MQFICRVGTPNGRVISQIREGSDAGRLRRSLEQNGFHVFSIRGQRQRFDFKLPGRRRRIPEEEFMVFNQELAALLRAGMPLLQSLDLMLRRTQQPRLRAVLARLSHHQVKTDLF